VSHRAVDQIGENLFDHCVPTMVGLGLGQREGAVGEHPVISVGGEQFALSLGGGFRVEPADAPHD
jgi:hypothetical protein